MTDMPRFMLLLSPRGSRGSPALLGARTARFVEWVARGRESGLIRDGACVSTSATVSCCEASESHDEPVERITGYLVVEADNLVAAIDVARSCPAADPGTVRVLELDEGAALGSGGPG